QGLLEGVGGMGVVDDPADRVVGDRLHPAGDSALGAERLVDLCPAAAYRGEQQIGGEGVGDVVAAGQGRAQGPLPLRAADGEHGAVAVAAQVGGDVVGLHLGPCRVGGHGDLRLGGEAAAPFVVHAHHAALRVGRREQGALGLVVALHRAVEVQVVLGEVREAGDVEDDLVGAMQYEGVAGDLHRDDLDAVLGHAGEEAVQLGRLGGGAHGRDGVVGA